VSLHRYLNTWAREVEAFIALTEFQRDLLISAGLPADRVHVKPNFLAGSPHPNSWGERENYVVYAGRLSQEKGVESLVRAWLLWGSNAPELRVLGDGPLASTLFKLATKDQRVPIRFLGHLGQKEVINQIARAKLVVVPSICFEGFPMVIREAYAYGTPVAAARIGPLPTIVREHEQGLLFDPGDASAMESAIKAAWTKLGCLEAMSAGARRAYETYYTEEVNYRELMRIYEHAQGLIRHPRSFQ